MKKIISRIFSLILAAIMVLSLCTGIFAAKGDKVKIADRATVLFTHDLHSHLLPSVADDGGEYGGYARLTYAIKKQKEKYPDAILVDAGDFSMGSIFQTAYAQSAIELRIMGAMGYDVTTFGNHEFDYLRSGLASMLNAAKASGDPLPYIVEANYLPPKKGEKGYDKNIVDAFENYGVRNYVILERGGVYFAVFGVFGLDADDCAPNSGMILHDVVEAAQKTVDAAKKECVEKYGAEPVVVCLSHAGTTKREGEDFELAKKTEGIDIIISGHTHSNLTEAVTVGETYIVSASEYCKYLGVVDLLRNEEGKFELNQYKLIPIDENTGEDAEMAALINEHQKEVEENYLSQYGVTFDEVIVHNEISFETVKQTKATQHESTFCNVFTDAYKWAVEEATGQDVDLSLTSAAVIRASLPLGDITTADVFNTAPLGVGTEGELIAVYITGSDLKKVLEIDASMQPLIKSAQLYFSGIEYSYNKKRVMFNKVDSAVLCRNDGTLEAIDDDKLYSVVTGMYVGQMLGTIDKASYGVLEITPRTKDGKPIPADKLADYVVCNSEGKPIKEWYAIASYLRSMGGDMDEKYAQPDGRKVVYSSLSPVKLLANANIFTYIVLIIILVIVGVIVLVTVVVVRKIKKKKTKKEE